MNDTKLTKTERRHIRLLLGKSRQQESSHVAAIRRYAQRYVDTLPDRRNAIAALVRQACMSCTSTPQAIVFLELACTLIHEATTVSKVRADGVAGQDAA